MRFQRRGIIYLQLQRELDEMVLAPADVFQYFEVPGTGIKVPMMTLGEDLMKMSLSDRDAIAPKSPKPPTLGEVKKSLRVCEKAPLRILTNYHLLVPCQAVDSRSKSDG